MSQDSIRLAQLMEAKQRELRAHLPHRVQALRALWGATRYETLSRPHLEGLYHLVHGLAGTAGTLGMVWANDSLQELERLLSAWLTADDIPADGPRLLTALLEGFFAAEARYRVDAPDSTYSLAAIRPTLPAPHMKGAILVFEDNHSEGNHLQAILELQGFGTQIHQDPATFLEAARANPQAILLVDIVAPGNQDQGLELIEELRKERTLQPKVVFMSIRDDLMARLAAIRAGGLYYFHKPLKFMELILVLDEIVAREETRPYRLLMVEDDELLATLFRLHLEAEGVTVRVLTDPIRLLEELETFKPELVLMDIGLPGCSGLELAAILRQHTVYRDMPLVFLSAESDPERQIDALSKGGEDFIQKPISPEQLVRQLLPRLVKRRDVLFSHIALKQEQLELMQLRAGLDAHAIVSVTDRSGRILYANDKFCQVSGYSRAELLGQTHRIVKSDLHPPAFFEEMWRTITAGSIWHGELQNRKKNGEYYWVETTIVPILDPDLKPGRFVAIRTEVTALHKAMESAKISEERLRRSQNFGNIGAWDWDVQTGKLLWSERIAPLFGFPLGELETTYEKFLNAVHPEDRQAVIDAVDACIERGVEYGIEHRVVWLDGSIHWVHEAGDAVRSEDGAPLHMLGVVQDITRRKEAEEALRVSEERFRLIAETIEEVFWMADVEIQTMYYISPAYERIWGRTLESLRENPSSFLEGIHPEDRDHVLSTLAAQKQGLAFDHEYRVVRPDGSIRWVWDRGFPVRSSDGRVTRYAGVARDITTRKESEVALRASEAQNEALINAIPDLIFTIHRNGEFLAVHAMDPSQLFVPPEAFLHHQVTEILPKPLAEQLKAASDAALEGNAVQTLFYSLPLGGRDRFFEARIAPSGEDSVITIVRDVTERKDAEEALAEAQKFHEQVIQSAQEGLIVYGSDLRYLAWNPFMETITGIPASEVLGKHPLDVFPFLEGAGVIERLKRTLVGEPVVSLEFPYEIPRNGRSGWVSDTSSPFRNAKGDIVGVIGVVTDITDRREVVASMERARLEAERANQAKSEFLSNMSHELRTPLNAILGFAQLMEAGLGTNPDVRLQRATGQITKAGWHLLELINEILDLSKVEAGKLDLTLEPVELMALAEECTDLIRPLAERAGITLKQGIGAGGQLWVTADRGRLKQVLINLLSNAVKYNVPQGEVRLLAGREGEHRLRIGVEDTGPGLEEDQRQQLFQPFERLGAQHRGIEGTGIGLALAKQLVEAMGGAIGCDSQPGQGSRFWIDLPISEGHPSSSKSLLESAPVLSYNPSQGRTILYVEDHPANLLLVKELVKLRSGIHLIHAPLAEVGIAFAKEHRPDLILMDINLPDMDGYAALKVLRESLETRSIPVVGISANALPTDIQKAAAAGFDDYLTKPLKVGIFLKMLDDRLGESLDSKAPGEGS